MIILRNTTGVLRSLEAPKYNIYRYNAGVDLILNHLVSGVNLQYNELRRTVTRCKINYVFILLKNILIIHLQ